MLFHMVITNVQLSVVRVGHCVPLAGFCLSLYDLHALNRDVYQRPCSAHAGHIGTDRSLLTGHDALLLQQIARDLLHALSHTHVTRPLLYVTLAWIVGVT